MSVSSSTVSITGFPFILLAFFACAAMAGRSFSVNLLSIATRSPRLNVITGTKGPSPALQLSSGSRLESWLSGSRRRTLCTQTCFFRCRRSGFHAVFPSRGPPVLQSLLCKSVLTIILYIAVCQSLAFADDTNDKSSALWKCSNMTLIRKLSLAGALNTCVHTFSCLMTRHL